MNSKFFLVMVVGCAAMFAGCGKNRTGTYTGSESINSPGAAAVSANNVSLNVSSDSNSTLTGSFSDTSGSSSFSGTVSGDGNSLQNVSLAIPAQGAGSTINGVPSSGCGGTYTGTLTLTDTQISGTLTLTSPQAMTQQQPYNGYQNGYPNGYPSTTQSLNPCQGATRNVNLTKSN
jgi:hypothetical protein